MPPALREHLESWRAGSDPDGHVEMLLNFLSETALVI